MTKRVKTGISNYPELQINIWEILPPEIVCEIYSFLPLKFISNLREVTLKSKELADVINIGFAWKISFYHLSNENFNFIDEIEKFCKDENIPQKDDVDYWMKLCKIFVLLQDSILSTSIKNMSTIKQIIRYEFIYDHDPNDMEPRFYPIQFESRTEYLSLKKIRKGFVSYGEFLEGFEKFCKILDVYHMGNPDVSSPQYSPISPQYSGPTLLQCSPTFSQYSQNSPQRIQASPQRTQRPSTIQNSDWE